MTKSKNTKPKVEKTKQEVAPEVIRTVISDENVKPEEVVISNEIAPIQVEEKTEVTLPAQDEKKVEKVEEAPTNNVAVNQLTPQELEAQIIRWRRQGRR